MNDIYDLALLFSPYPSSSQLDTPAEVWTNLAIGLLSAVTVVICICRINALNGQHKLIVRLRYIILFVGSTGTALAPWAFPANPRIGGIFLGASLVVYLLLSAAEWKRGAPAYTKTDWGDLTEREQDDELRLDALGSVARYSDTLWGKLQRCTHMVAYILRGGARRHVQRRHN